MRTRRRIDFETLLAAGKERSRMTKHDTVRADGTSRHVCSPTVPVSMKHSRRIGACAALAMVALTLVTAFCVAELNDRLRETPLRERGKRSAADDRARMALAAA